MTLINIMSCTAFIPTDGSCLQRPCCYSMRTILVTKYVDL